jgi:hypothetical protein
LRNFVDRIEAASTHYEVLAITAEASADDVKRVYYDFARRYHRIDFVSSKTLRFMADRGSVCAHHASICDS